MSSKGNKLIRLYEAEKASITSQMNVCLAEGEYAKAHIYSKELLRTNRRLHTLHRLCDSNYIEIKRCVTTINQLENLLATLTNTSGTHYYVDSLAAERRKLDELKNKVNENAQPNKSSILQDTLTKLLDEKISNFTLVLSQKSGFCFNFKMVKCTLIISLPEVRRHRAEYSLDKKQIRSLSRQGFRLYDNKDKLMAILPFESEADLDAVTAMLTKVVFEVLYFERYGSESFIKYFEKDSE